MLFGHQDNGAQHGATQVAPTNDMPQQSDPAQLQGVNPLAVDPDTGASLPTVPPDSPGPVDTAQPPSADVQDNPSVLDQPSAAVYHDASFNNDPAPVSPFSDDQVSSHAFASVEVPTDQPSPVASVQPAQSFTDYSVAAPAVVDSAVPASDDDLLGIKQQALSQLGSLVRHLDQSPEEKFRTTMMLIQSTDNPTLLKEAYAVAQSIPDEKVRAQALLDVVNEINYFTQQPVQPGSGAQTA